MSFISFDRAAMDAVLNQPAAQRAMSVFAQPTLLSVAQDNCSTKYPGWPRLNPAPGTVHSDTGVFMRSELFRDTLQLDVSADGELQFKSPAVSVRRRSGISFDYGQALIDGRAPFAGPYKLLPPEYY